MRLTLDQINAFKTVFNEYSFQGELRLYGSRTDEKALGGDIDLILLVKTHHQYKQLQEKKYDILVKIKNLIGDQKIDLLMLTFEKARSNAFVLSILPNSILIHAWE